MATDIKKLAEELVNMTILEVNELKNLLKDEYGIEPLRLSLLPLPQPMVALLPMKANLNSTSS